MSRIKVNKPALKLLSDVDLKLVSRYDDVVIKFTSTLKSIGGEVMEINSLGELKNIVTERNSSGKLVINTLPQLGKVDAHLIALSKEVLADVDAAVIKGEIAVAENGAEWLYESQMINRLLLFICQHLILIIEKKNIVATMHHAYQQMDISRKGFGVFIARPLKLLILNKV